MLPDLFDDLDELVCAPGPVLVTAVAVVTCVVGSALGVAYGVLRVTGAAMRRARGA